MNTRNVARLTMFQSVADFLAKNTEITNQLPGFAELFLSLNEHISAIQGMINEQLGDTSGISITKVKEKEELIRRTLALSGKMVAYAKMKNDEILLHKVKLTNSQLNHLTAQLLAGQCQVLANDAAENLAQLESYKVTAAEIEELRQACTTYIALIPKPREARRDAHQVTQAIEKKVEETLVLLEKMDALVQILRFSAAEFYTHYRSSRKVLGNGSRSHALLGKIIDTKTGMGISNVTISIFPQNGNGKNGTSKPLLQKKTAPKGSFAISTLDSGTYQVHASKEGYEPQTMTVFITAGERYKVELLMSAT